MPDIVRWNEWSEGKIPNFIFLIFYLMLSQGLKPETSLYTPAIIVLFFSFFFAFSYALNDYCDRNTDKKKGKIAQISLRSADALLLILLLSGISLLTVIPPISALIGLSMYVLSMSYSTRPLRLKERGLAGIVTSAVSQQTLPALLIFSSMPSCSCAIDLVLFTLFLSALGFRRIFEHQVEDFQADKHAGVRTFAQSIGLSGATKLTGYLEVLEQASLLLILIWMGLNITALLVLPLVYAILILWRRSMRAYITYYMSGLISPYFILSLLILSDTNYAFAILLCIPFTYRLILKLFSYRGGKI